MVEAEAYSNPIAPSHARGYDEDDEDEKNRLTNSDFRKLLMTPRDAGKQTPGATPRVDHFNKPKLRIASKNPETALLRKKRKSYYAQLKKEEDEREKELQEKYRDRAKERRVGNETTTTTTETTAEVSTTVNYKAVAPEEQKEANYAARRKQVIEESKYLGGDMKHTHLVKGLDYSLLEKVKAEIHNKEQEELEAALEAMNEKEFKETEVECRTKLAKDILRIVEMGRSHRVLRKELFEPGRMAYIFDLEDKEQDVPTTLIRSRAECNRTELSLCISNNDIIVNKVMQIFNEMKTGKNRDKKKKKDKLRVEDIALPPTIEEDIFELEEGQKDNVVRRKDIRSDKNKSYFEKPPDEDTEMFEAPKAQQVHEFVKNVTAKFAKSEELKQQQQQQQEEEGVRKFKKNMMVDSYAECYPGMVESVDAFGDSDDEADYTKMDQGNKKGPVGRWDFENQEEYSSYMGAREAMPKAAFQYGVKMADGRKTRRAGPRDDKKEHDREWATIQTMIAKRRPDEGPSNKKHKM